MASWWRRGGWGDFALARYNADGSLDTTFGTGGKVTTDFGGFDNASALVVQPDGKLVAAGDSDANFALARYNADGTLDTSFGTGGMVTTGFFGGPDHASALVVQPDGKLVAAGDSYIGGPFHFALARYNADGSLDLTFGTGGKVTTDFGGISDGASALVLQLDGKLVAAGDSGGPFHFALARYNADGTLDTTFGGGTGKVTTGFGGFDGAAALILQPNGKLVAAGHAGILYGPFDFALARYNTDGTLDATFGTGGKVTTDFGEADGVSALVLQPDGKLVASGGASVGDPRDFALARYLVTHTLTVTQAGTGSGTVISDPAGIYCDPICGSSFAENTPVTFITTPDPGSIFAGYSGDCGPDGTVTMNADKTCIATFNLANGPDLTGTWNSLSQICRPIRGTQRCRLMGRVSIVNQGSARARRASMLRFFLSSDGITPETFLRQVAVGALRTGQIQARMLSAPLPLGTTATGKFVIAVLDASNAIVETVETNNVIVFGPLP